MIFVNNVTYLLLVFVLLLRIKCFTKIKNENLNQHMVHMK